MKSKLTIDLDQDNQPVIKIDYVYSEDVRDKMVKRFLETFGGSCWANFRYTEGSVDDSGINNSKAIIRPICNYDLPEQVKTMQIEADLQLKSRKQVSI